MRRLQNYLKLSVTSGSAVEIASDDLAVISGDALITQEQFMVMIAELNGKYDEASVFSIPADFSDVSEEEWYAPFVWYAFYQGWTAGKGDGTFGVGSSVSLKTVANFVLESEHYTVVSYENIIEQLKLMGVEVDVADENAITFAEYSEVNNKLKSVIRYTEKEDALIQIMKLLGVEEEASKFLKQLHIM